MSQPWTPQHDAVLEYPWGAYRAWAATARELKAELSAWRNRVLLLTIAGAVFGTISSELAKWGLGSSGWFSLPTIVGLIGGVAVALAAFFTREILSPDRERRWVRARSTADSLKSEVLLFRLGVPPYDEPDALDRFTDRTEALLKPIEGVESVALTPEQKRERLPTGSLTIDAYIEERVRDQINFYDARIREYRDVLARGRRVSLVLLGVATILGVIAVSEWTAGWIAVIAAVTASVAAYLSAGRYQELIVSYQATVRRLESLLQRWQGAGGPTAGASRHQQLVRDCEGAISAENGAWMSRWLDNK